MLQGGSRGLALAALALGGVGASTLGQVGACCLNDTGACLVATQADCDGPLNGSWQGAGVTCAEDLPCTTTSYGACCTPDGCIAVPGFVCTVLSGAFLGAGTPCAVTTYEQTTLPPSAWIELSNPTALSFVDDGSGFGAGDEGVAMIALPMDFTFEGRTYVSGEPLYVHTNGFVSFDVIDVTNRPDTYNFFLEFAPDASTPNAAICPLWSDQVSASVRTQTVVASGATTLVVEWDTAPLTPQHFAGAYQLHLISAPGDPALDGAIRFVYRDEGEPLTPLTDPASGLDDNRLFVGMHSAGGLSVFRADVVALRSLLGAGAGGVQHRPAAVDSGCVTNVCSGDFDGDGDVDLSDFGVFGGAFGSAVGDANYDPRADFDDDGDVDLSDFGVFGGQFGRVDCLQ